MLEKICLIVHENLYRSKYHFTQKFAEALRRQKIEVSILDIKGGELRLEDISRIHQQSPSFTCSFNTILPLRDGHFLWDALEIPHLSIVVDPVIYSMNLTNSPYSVIGCVDRFDCELVRGANFPHVFFFPHAVERELAQEPLNEDRPYDVVLLGSCYDHESLRAAWQKQYPRPICDAIEYAIELVLKEPETTFVQAVLKSWNFLGLNPREADFIPIFNCIDNYIRGKDRYDLLRSLKDVHVHVFGSLFWEENPDLHGWDYYLGSEKNITVHPPVPYEDALRVLKQSKICLNSTPFFKNGSHERLFASLATGCAVMSSENRYVRENFSREEGVELYQHKSLETVNDKIHDWLSHENKRKDAVVLGRTKVAAHHTWDQRAQQLMEEMPPILGRIYASTINPN